MVVRHSGTGGGLSAAVERLSTNAHAWGPRRVLDEGLDLIRDSTWADVSILYELRDDQARVVGRRPGANPERSATGPDFPDVLPGNWFPWGLAPVNPKRYLLADEARALPTCPGGAPTLGELGLRSCLHLPILERSCAIGAIHLYWSEPRLAWDDDRGRLLRLLGRFLLSSTEG